MGSQLIRQLRRGFQLSHSLAVLSLGSPCIHLLPHPHLWNCCSHPGVLFRPARNDPPKKMAIKPRDLIKSPPELCMRCLHLLGRDSHAGTDHVQGVGDHGSRGASQGAGNEPRERCQCPGVRGESREQMSPPEAHPIPWLLGMALLCLLGTASHATGGNPWGEEAQGWAAACCFCCSFHIQATSC